MAEFVNVPRKWRPPATVNADTPHEPGWGKADAMQHLAGIGQALGHDLPAGIRRAKASAARLVQAASGVR